MSTQGPAPGFIKHPDHQVRITSSDHRWTVRDDDTLLADSHSTFVLEETGYERVIYFPPEDVSLQLLTRMEQVTTCPFKGEANYLVQATADKNSPIAWTYLEVFDEVAAIKGYIAFYEDRVDLQAGGVDG